MAIALLGTAPPEVGGAPAKTTTIVYRADSAFGVGDKHLVQAMIPITGKLPVFYHPTTGEKCDLIPGPRNVYGNPDLYQLVSLHTVATVGQSSVEFTTEPEVPKIDPGPRYNTTNVDNLTVAIVTTAGQTLRARVGDGILKRVWRTGNWVDEREIWVRSTTSTGGKGPGVRFWIDRRADQTIRIQFIIENTCCNLSLTNLSNPDPEGAEEVYFSQINFEGIPSSYFFVQDEMEFGWSQTNSNLIVRPENVMGGSGPEQLIPLGAEYPFAYTLRSSLSNTAKATAVGRFVGYGFPQSGDYTVFSGQGYGASRGFGFDISDPRINHEATSGTGLASSLERDTLWLAELKGLISAGVGGGQYHPFFTMDRNGCYFPYGPTNLRDAGEAGVDLWGMGGLHGEGFRIAFLRARLTMQRHHSGLVNANNGEQITAEDLVAIKGIDRNPWQCTFRGGQIGSERWNNESPCFLRQAFTTSAEWPTWVSGNSDILAARAIGGAFSPWSSPSTLASTDPNLIPQPMALRRQTERREGAFYPPVGPNKAEGNHHARYFGCLDPLAYGANMGFAKYLIVKEGIYIQRCFSRFLVDPAYSTMNGAYFEAICSMQHCLDIIAADGKPNWGGYKRVNKSSTSQNRGNGMIDYCVANAYRFADLAGSYRSNTDLWIAKAVETFAAVATTYGATIRNDATDSDANQPATTGFAIQAYPASDKVGPTNLSTRQGALPLDDNIWTLPNQEDITYETGSNKMYSLAQTFQIGYRHMGMTALAHAALEPGSALWNQVRNLCTKFTQYMYTYARRADKLIPPSIVLVSEGSGGVFSAPGAGQGPWPGGDIRPGEWTFEVSEQYGLGFTFTVDWNLRSLITICNEINMAYADADLVTVGQLFQYIKDFHGVPSGTVEDVLNQIFTTQRYNNESSIQRYQNEYLRSQYGFVIGTITGLRAKGALV